MIDTNNIMGKKTFFRNPSENKSKFLRRSIFIVKNIKKGEKFTEKNIRRIRPNFGLQPKFYYKVLGKRSKNNLYFGNPLQRKHIK